MGLFGRKKESTPPAEFDPQDIIGIPPEIARVMLSDWAEHHGGSFPETLSATLEFDAQGRVTKFDDPRANDVPYVPTPDALARLNQVLSPLATAPEKYRATGFSFEFDRGEFSGEFSYPTQ